MTRSKKVMLHTSWSVSTHLWCFGRSNWSLSKVIAEKSLVTFQDLKYPWRHDEGSLVAIFRFRVSNLPVTRCLWVFWMVFVQKRRLSFFLHWLIMVRSQNWPDLKSPIAKFRDICFIYKSLKVSRWSLIRCSYYEHSNLFWGEVNWCDLLTWSWVTLVSNFHKMCGKDVWTGMPKKVARAPPFFILTLEERDYDRAYPNFSAILRKTALARIGGHRSPKL